jgi:[acyl-carrier-protein] S-malonyltransferase
MIAVVFPGQGSQAPGMGRDLYSSSAAARETFDRVGRALGIDATKLCFEIDDETLRQTQNAQLALYTVGVAAYKALVDSLDEPDRERIFACAGHSVGEYAALAAAGGVSVEDGAKLVARRGQVMAEAGKDRPGTMAAILGLERGLLEEVCKDAGGLVVVANDNCPGQLVVSGEIEAVQRASELAKERGAKRAVPLNVAGAFHSPLMERPAELMGQALKQATFSTPALSIYSNVTSEPAMDGGSWPDLLERQLRSPVRWTETVEHLRRDGALTFVECGWGDVLSGLIRRTDKESITMKVVDPTSLESTVAALAAQRAEA